MGFVIGTENHEVVDLSCSATIPITQEFIAFIFVGKKFDRYYKKLEDEVTRRYFGTSQKAIIIAYKDALKICNIAEVYGMECMIGCMLEAKVSVNAAVHLAAAKKIITKIDLDGPVLCSEDPVDGGAIFNEVKITLNDEPGFGIKQIHGVKYI